MIPKLSEVSTMTPQQALRWRLRFSRRSDRLVRALELRCLEDTECAYKLRRHARRLPSDVKRLAELKACESEYWLNSLSQLGGLNRDTLRVIELVRIGTSPVDALRCVQLEPMG